MATNRVAYDVLQTTMARQRVTVYDLYGLLGVSPNANEAAIRDAYDSTVKNAHHNIPSNVVSHHAIELGCRSSPACLHPSRLSRSKPRSTHIDPP